MYWKLYVKKKGTFECFDHFIKIPESYMVELLKEEFRVTHDCKHPSPLHHTEPRSHYSMSTNKEVNLYNLAVQTGKDEVLLPLMYSFCAYVKHVWKKVWWERGRRKMEETH